MKNVIVFVKKEIVLVISLVLAVISAFLIHPNKEYIEYIDFRTLAILFCLMTIMAALQRLNVFGQIGEGLVGAVSSIRLAAIILVLLCFVFSMFITNDVALITFVPFTIIVLHISEKEQYLISVVVMETVAANLGSMMLPMGNPQNLFLFSLSGLSFGRFILLMLPYALLSLVLILLLTMFFVKGERINSIHKSEYRRTKQDKMKIGMYLTLFVISLLVVVRIIDYRIGFLIVLLAVLIVDRKILLSVDYSLLFTFIFLFIFIGNLKHIDTVSVALSKVVSGNEIGVSILSSQVISNVPAAILLSGFTDNIKGLIVGTNLGGLGTLIASMASLISFKIYSVANNANKGKYMKVFTLVNVGMLIVLWLVSFLFS